MKRINKITFSALALPIAITPVIAITSCKKNPAAPSNFSVDSNGLVSATDEAKSLSELVVPAFVNDQNVKGIANNGFKGCQATSITFEQPLAINSIGDNAFEGCVNLKSFTVPTFVKSIGVAAFSGCESLSEFSFDAVDCRVREIKERTFEKTKIVNITFPSTIRVIGPKAFLNNAVLKKVEFKTTIMWSQIGKSQTFTTDAPEYNANCLRQCDESAVNNWGYTGINRTAKTASVNYSALTDAGFSINNTTTTVAEKDGWDCVSFGIKAKQDKGGLHIVSLKYNTTLINSTEYDIGDSQYTNCYLSVLNWERIDDGATLNVTITKE